MKKLIRNVLVLAATAVIPAVMADESGFLSDYSELVSRSDNAIGRIYFVPDSNLLLGKYQTVMVDQPEIFLAPDSKYKGAKPDALKALADTMRLAAIERLEAGNYRVTDEPGPGVLYMRWAVTDLYLQKEKRSILTYTPVGFVAHTAKGAVTKDLWKKIDIVEIGIEIEILDSVSNERLVAAVMEEGARKEKGQKEDRVTWEELDAVMGTTGERIRCLLDNAHAKEAKRADCSAIVIQPEA